MLKKIVMMLSLAFFGMETGWAQTPAQLIETSGIRGGLVVHLGCGDGMRTAQFRLDERFLVQGLDTLAENVDRARRQIEARGLYGVVSVDTFDGTRLPYIDNGVDDVAARSGPYPQRTAAGWRLSILRPRPSSMA